MRTERSFVAAGLAVLVALSFAWGEPAWAVPPAQASQPVVKSPQDCSAAQPGTVEVAFQWTPSHQGQQWLDLSLFNNGFAPGTFVSVGPLPRDEDAFLWNGLLSGRSHYVRVNTLAPDGWAPSATLAFVTAVCGQPVAGLGTPAQWCSSQHPGRAKVLFNWTPGVLPGTSQYLDLSIFNNGFAPGTFIGVGPLPSRAGAFLWDGLVSGTTHYWRVNTLAAGRWYSSTTGSFTTGMCGPVSRTYRSSYFEVTLNSIIDPYYSGNISAPRAGNRYVAYDLTVRNINPEGPMVVSPFDFLLRDAAGYAHSTALLLPTGGLAVITLRPGETVRGGVGFEIPANARPITLIFEPLCWFQWFRTDCRMDIPL